MKFLRPLYLMLFSILFSLTPTTPLSASTVPALSPKHNIFNPPPIDKKVKQQQKKRLKSKLKKAKKKHPNKSTHEAHFPWFWLLIAWYVLFLTLLIIGLVLQIGTIWITAVVFLATPPTIALITFIIMLLSLAFGNANLE